MIPVLVDLDSRAALVAALPAEREVTRVAPKLWYVSAGGEQLFVREVFENQSRWIAAMVGTRGAFQLLRGRLQVNNVQIIDRDFYLARESQLNAIGFNPVVRNGKAFIKMPHVICGQSPWIEVGP